MQLRIGFWMVCVLCWGLPAMAKRPELKQPAPPSLDEVLTEAGWTMTPERTSTYSVGDVYSRASNSPVLFKKDCFDADPREGVYTSLEVIQAMKAGTKLPLGMVRVNAGGMSYKQITFAEPYVTELASLQLAPSPQCKRLLSSVDDAADLFVITAVLSAEIKEQMCQTIDAGARVAGIGVSGSANQECTQASEGHVVVAYRTEDWLTVLSNAPDPVDHRTTAIGKGAAAATAGGFEALPSLDMRAKLRLQTCDAEAAATGARAREARLEEAKHGAAKRASDAWQAMHADLEQCMTLSNNLRVDCVRAVESWLNQARSLRVDLPSGEEAVDTECGVRHPAFDAQSLEFQADEVAVAETMLRRLNTENTRPTSEGTFAVTFQADPGDADTLHVMCHVGGLVQGDTTARLANAGPGPCRIEGFRGTETVSTTFVLREPGTYRCFAQRAPSCAKAP